LACGRVDIPSGEQGEIPNVVGTEWFAKVHCDKKTYCAVVGDRRHRTSVARRGIDLNVLAAVR
jgi:hypothetical protein